MRQWRAIVPFRPAEQGGAGAKTRLAGRLDAPTRAALATAMAIHVLETLQHCPLIGSITLLAPSLPGFVPAGIEWIADHRRGLNAELGMAIEAVGNAPALIIHADLPLLCADDVAAMAEAAQTAGAAIAPDHAQTGTNALALADPAGLALAFGRDSFALHRRLLPHAIVVTRNGLGLDIDTPDDLDRALAAGLHWDLPGIAGPI